MKRVLIVSYDFPPSSIGIWRTLKFCRYMREHGWEPAILTVKPVRSPRFDYGPLKELPEGTEVRRTPSLDPNRLAYLLGKLRDRLRGKASVENAPAKKSTNAIARRAMDVLRAWLFVPDDRILWYPFALAEARRWLREGEFDAVYTTCFPHTAHLVGAKVAAEFDLPLIADFRDIWVGNYYFFSPATRLHGALQRRLERWVIECADRAIGATRPIVDDFLERYPKQPKDKFATITNGFDPCDFPDSSNVEIDREHFTILYAGTMYGSTSPRDFFTAVRTMLKKYPTLRDVLRLRFIGAMIEPYREMIEKCGLEDVTHVENYLSHDEALNAMAAADMLLLIVSPQKGSHIMLTQKVFEYAAARRPIFGIVPQGAARDFLQELGEGPIVAPGDIKGMARALYLQLDAWKKTGRTSLQDNLDLAKYERRRLAGEMCHVLDEAVAARSKS